MVKRSCLMGSFCLLGYEEIDVSVMYDQGCQISDISSQLAKHILSLKSSYTEVIKLSHIFLHILS